MRLTLLIVLVEELLISDLENTIVDHDSVTEGLDRL
jgi:hypothetical protein